MGTSIVRIETTSGAVPRWAVLSRAAIFTIDLEMSDHREVMQHYFKKRSSFDAAKLAKVRFLQPGDALELEIKSVDGSIDLGRQTNKIVDA